MSNLFRLKNRKLLVKILNERAMREGRFSEDLLRCRLLAMERNLSGVAKDLAHDCHSACYDISSVQFRRLLNDVNAVVVLKTGLSVFQEDKE